MGADVAGGAREALGGAVAVTDLEEGLRIEAEEGAGRVAREWFTAAQDTLLDRGEDYEGVADQAEVQGVVQSGSPPQSTPDGDWEFTFSHPAAAYFEYGTEPHKITPNPPNTMLKFPWHDPPSGIEERFRPQWEDPMHFLEEPEVLLPEVDHPGTPELRWLRDSRDEVGGE